MRRLFSAVLVAGLALIASPATAQGQLKIVASFSILGDMVRQVTGELANVTTIVGPDADATSIRRMRVMPKQQLMPISSLSMAWALRPGPTP